MPQTFDINSARNAGYSEQDIQNYLKQNPTVQTQQAPLPTSGPAPTLSFLNSQPQTQSGGNNSALDFLLPTAGGVLGGIGGAFVPVLGETGVSEVAGAAGGQAAGQALANVLQGRAVGQDVANNAVQGGIGGVFGLGMGKILGPVLSKTGGFIAGKAESLLGKATPDVLNKVVDDTPWFSTSKNALTKTAADAGLLDGTTGQGLDKMPTIMQNLDSQIKTAIQNNPSSVPITTASAGKQSAVDNFISSLEKSNYTEGELKDAVNEQLNRFSKLGDGQNASIADIYAEKQKLGNQLASTFKQVARGNTLSPTSEVRLAAFDSLKNTIDQYGSSDIRTLNTTQNHMYDIAKAFVRDHISSAGKVPSKFSFSDLFPTGAGAAAASLMGGNPLLGMALGYGMDKVAENPSVLGSLGNILGKAGSTAGNKSFSVGSGVAVGNAMKSLLGTGNPPDAQNQNGYTNNDISQSNSSPSTGQMVSQGTGGSQGGIKSFDGKTTFPANLPAPNQISNQIPGQIYPQEQYLKDVQTVQNDIQRAGSNPQALSQLESEMGVIQAKKAANDAQVKNYIDQNGLDADAIDFVRTANPTYQTMNDLRGLITKQGGQDAFHAFINASPQVQQVKALTDPTGQYSLMLNLMNQARTKIARAQVGGRLSNFDIALVNAFSPGQTTASNLANLDHAQKMFLDQYNQYAPLYNLSLTQDSNTANGSQIKSYTNNPALDSILNSAAQ